MAIIIDKIWEIVPTISKPPLVFPRLVAGQCKAYIIDFPDNYHRRIDSLIDDDFVCHQCMTQKYRVNNLIIKSLPPNHNQQESICL